MVMLWLRAKTNRQFSYIGTGQNAQKMADPEGLEPPFIP